MQDRAFQKSISDYTGRDETDKTPKDMVQCSSCKKLVILSDIVDGTCPDCEKSIIGEVK